MQIGIPLKLIHQSLGFVVVVDLKNGEQVRGTVLNVEDNMNILLKDATLVQRNGKSTKLSVMFVRGSMIVYITFPDMLQYSPIFRDIQDQATLKTIEQ